MMKLQQLIEKAKAKGYTVKVMPDSGESGNWAQLKDVTNPDTRYYFETQHPELVPAEWKVAQ